MNPYIKPEPTPTPAVPKKTSWSGVFLFLIALGGWFLPYSGDFTLPPFNDADPAKTENSWVVVIEETEMRTPQIAKVLSDEFWSGLKDRGLRWRFYDYDSPDTGPYREPADEVGVPATIIVGGKDDLLGQILDKFPLPSTVEELDAKVKKATGR